MKFDDELVINGRKYYRRSDWKDSKVPRGVLEHDCIICFKVARSAILGDPGAVSRVGKGATKVCKYGQKSPWVLTLTKLFLNSFLGTKNALYYCAQSANTFS